MNKKGSIEPLNFIMGFVAIMGAVLIITNRGDYGLILLIIATLIEAISRVLK
ncbi:MAG: hypothetical protein AABX65_00860 [Nanoarchaeota archaeon]